MVSLILGVVIAALGVVAAILRKKGKEKAAGYVDVLLGILERLKDVLKGNLSATQKEDVIDQMEQVLSTLEAIGTKKAKEKAAEYREFIKRA